MFDARYCRRHPTVRISSDDGMLDGVCGDCEGECERATVAWDHNTTNPRRPFCAPPSGPWGEPLRALACLGVEDGICF
jgi:hypothetical protein